MARGFLEAEMTYREYIKEVFDMSQSVLKEYTALCLKVHAGRIDPTFLKECDEKFMEYNRLLSLHHELVMKVSRGQRRMEEKVTETD